MNYNAIDSAKEHLVKIDIPAAWATTTSGAEMVKLADNDYFRNVVAPILALEGDKLPSSAFNADGTVPTGTTKFEKRGVAVMVPDWNINKCIQCNQCSFVCPHACIRPYLVGEGTQAPASFATKPALQAAGYGFRMQVSPLDCMGCGVCAEVCPVNKKAKSDAEKNGAKVDPAALALNMVPFAEAEAQAANWDYAQDLPDAPKDVVAKMADVKKSQFTHSLFEFSGACAGCGETPYVKVVTQLFGDRMIVANATGCSSIYGGSSPTCPYTVNKEGHGPAWANSLFEDNAEFGYGMNLAYKARRAALADKITKLEALWQTPEGKAACKAWVDGMDDAEASKAASAELLKQLEGCTKCGRECEALVKEILEDKDCLVKKSFWIIGGDGWAYDIGYGGLDHVLASGEDVNVLVLDTEVYSNTGGQASKATPIGAVAKFASSGKRVKKKDLGMIAASYGYVYVAQCAMGADQAQLVKALKEAEAYHGPSIVICYAPCINHGINMTKSQAEEKNAVDCGYWHLYRYNPDLAAKGQNPFTLDSKDPTGDYQAFILGETRYASLKKTQPAVAEELFKRTEESSKERLAGYKKMAGKE